MKEWVKIEIPLSAGLQNKGDERAGQPPGFDLLRDVEFEEMGGIQTRKPFAEFGSSIVGGGTIADPRRLVENGDELILFTKTALYSWSAALSGWVLKSTHLAVKTDEVSRFVTTGDQVTPDRAELNGTVVYTWVDGGLGYVAALDKTTGAVILAPTALPSENRPRVVALSTRILLFSIDPVTPALNVRAIDPASPAAGVASSPTAITTSVQSYYDVVRVAATDQAVFACRYNPTTSYLVGTVTAGLAVNSTAPARTCDGPIAVSVEPTGTQVQVVRANGANIEGDLLTVSTLANVYTAQAIGTASGTINQVTAAHRSVQNSSVYRCYAFWSSAESTGATDWLCKHNWVSTGNTLGTQATFMRRLGVASRAFDHGGSVFLWLAFAGESSFSGASPVNFRAQLQNSYFLYRDDITLHAKSVFQRGGGFSASTGLLGGVANVGGSEYAWAGVVRRVIELGERQTGYDSRSPRDVLTTFDSNEARRCARLGQTLYITGGEILQYDGRGLYETGYHVYPWYFGAIEVGTGNLVDGTYGIKNTFRWHNAKGEIDRSTTATHGTVTIAGGPNGISIVSWIPLYVTHKTGVAVEVWRSGVDALPDAPFHLVTSKDPTAASNPNRYITNDSTASVNATFNDEFADATATTKEPSPENGLVLENLAPPSATIIAASADRLFLAGIAGDPDRVWYSKLRGDGEVASFHDTLTANVPPEGGAITALAFLNETLVVFRETAIYILPGQGKDNLGNGENFGPATKVSADVGAVSAETLARTDAGVFFKSSKGFYMLTSRFSCDYIGYPVAEFDTDVVRATHALESRHQIRVVTDERIIMFDYRAGQWVEWTIADGIHAALWQGQYLYLNASVPKVQRSDFIGIEYGMDVETAWIKLNDLQGAGSVRWLSILGEYRGVHHLRVRLARDYLQNGSGDWLWYQDETWEPSPTVIGGPEMVRVGPSVPRCMAIKVRITAVRLYDGFIDDEPAEITGWPETEALKLTGLALELGIDKNINRRLPVAQKAGV